MTSPRHLWSGDWEHESDAAAEQRRRLDALAEQPVEPEPEPATAPRRRRLAVPRRQSRPRLPRLRLPRLRLPRIALLVVAAALLSAAAAFAIVAAFGGPGGNGGGRPWLGVNLTSSPIMAGGFQSGFGGFQFAQGAEVAAVVPGGPAAAAGIVPGDVITQVGQQAVNSPASLQSAIADLQVGDRVEVRYEQGPLIFTTQVTLRARPAGYR
jgi:hypothetical protein